MTTEEAKKKIDAMSYQELLEHWRFAPAGDPMFVGEVGDYYKQVMQEKRQAIGPAGHTAASKAIGWD